MSVDVAVVIPAKNEERMIDSSIRSARDSGATEIVVADGGSTDATTVIARSLGAVVIETGPPRSKQMNAGVDVTSADAICFLHADTLLPSGACQAVSEAVEHGAVFGGFLLRFAERTPGLAFAEFMINARTRLTRAPWGDQAQFFLREAFVRAGRYAAIPIMEDYDMALRMKKRSRPTILPLKVTTSGRRFLELGLVTTALTNWRIVLAWHMGVSPERLRRLYGSR